MADSTSPIQQVTQNSGAITQINENFDAGSPALLYGRNAATTTGLTWGYCGGRFNSASISNGTVTLTGNATNYVVAAVSTGVVSVSTSTTNWNDTTNYIRLYLVIVNVSNVVTSYEDHRTTVNLPASTTVSDGDKGDITVSTSGTVWTIDNDAVTYAKMQNVSATSRLLGRGSAAGSGDVQEISLGAGLSMSGTTLSATATGATELKGLTFTSDTASQADSDPGAGLFRWNNATQASATQLFFDNSTADAVSVSTYWASLGSAGFIYLQQGDDATKWQLWRWTATPTNGTGYYKFAVTLQASSGSIDNTKTVYTTFEGASSAGGSTQGRQEIYIDAGSMRPSFTGGCSDLTTIASGTNLPDIVSLDFDPTTQEFAQFKIAMPKKWNEGTITFRAYWSHAATTTNFGVVWQLQGSAVSDNEAIGSSYGTAQTSTDTGGTTSNLYSSPESSAITIGNTPAAGDMIFFRFARNPADGSDTLAVDARLHGITIFVTTDADTDA